FADLRYAGQSHEITIPFSANLAASFAKAHQRRFGYHRADARVEVVTLRVRARASAGIPVPTLQEGSRVYIPGGGLFPVAEADGEAPRGGRRHGTPSHENSASPWRAVSRPGSAPDIAVNSPYIGMNSTTPGGVAAH